MPIYEFRCKECGKVSEFQMKMSDPNPQTCPSCGREKSLNKIMSLPSFQLKGGGWYSEGYDGKSNKTAASGPKSESSDSGSSSPSSSSSSESSSTPAAPASGSTAKKD